MWFHIPVKVIMTDKNSRKFAWRKANIALQLKDPKLRGPSIVIKGPAKTVRIDIRSIYGHADPLNLAVHGGGFYRFALIDTYESPENRVMLVRLIEIAKMINKGREFTEVELIASMSADPMVQRFRKTWLQMMKEFPIPRTEFYMSRVNLTGQNLKTIPLSLGNVLLRDIILDDNLLGEKDHFWTWLKGPVRFSLRYLSVKNNKLKKVPSTVVMCTKLAIVNFANNDLRYLPHKLFWPRVELKKIDVSNNPNLLFWPNTTILLQEVNVEGCDALMIERTQNLRRRVKSPNTLADYAASVILNHSKDLCFHIGTLPNTLVDKLNNAVLCIRCNKFFTNPASYSKFSVQIAAQVHIGLPRMVASLRFYCGCTRNRTRVGWRVHD